MKNNEVIKAEVTRLLDGINEHERVLRVRTFIQHGKITTYDHCFRVAAMSYRINKMFKLKSDEKALIRGAFLHDYFLYDWHKKKVKFKNLKDFFKLHGFMHPSYAAANAKRDFGIGEKEENIIRSHMWPLTVTKIPKCREAVIVCIADKLTSATETILRF